MASMTRGPLPPEVYWRRRLFVGLLAVTLVFLFASVLNGGSDGSDNPTARQAGSVVEPSTTVTLSDKPERGGSGTKNKGKKRNGLGPIQGPVFDPDVLGEPQGKCDPTEVAITPRVTDAVAGRDVTIGLSIRSLGKAACTFQFGPAHVAVKITDQEQEVWTSRECPAALPKRQVVVRDVVATVVEITWDAKESDNRCATRGSDWAQIGDYTISAAAFGGDPESDTFELASPTPETVAPETEGPEGDGNVENNQTGSGHRGGTRPPRR